MTLLEIKAFARWDGLPSRPSQLMKIMNEVGQASSMDYNIVEMIQHDVSIACRVLKIANSPLYGYAGQIASLQQACGLLGPEMIKNIVLTTHAVELYQENGERPQPMIDCSGLWVHMAVTGAIAGCFGKIQGDGEADVFFTAGLIHGIGKIALAVSQPAIFAECLERHKIENISLEEAETGIIGFSHAAIGLIMGAAWGYPAQLVKILKGQAVQDGLANDDKLSCAVHLAKYIAGQLGYGDGLGPQTPSPTAIVWSGAGIAQDEVKESWASLREIADKTARIMTA